MIHDSTRPATPDKVKWIDNEFRCSIEQAKRMYKTTKTAGLELSPRVIISHLHHDWPDWLLPGHFAAQLLMRQVSVQYNL